MRLIDADTLKAEFTGNFGGELWHYTGIWAIIGTAPTIDAVPVVRCAECEKRDKSFVSAKGTISCPYMEAFMAADDFCSYGERKDGEG